MPSTVFSSYHSFSQFLIPPTSFLSNLRASTAGEAQTNRDRAGSACAATGSSSSSLLHQWAAFQMRSALLQVTIQLRCDFPPCHSSNWAYFICKLDSFLPAHVQLYINRANVFWGWSDISNGKDCSFLLRAYYDWKRRGSVVQLSCFKNWQLVFIS